MIRVERERLSAAGRTHDREPAAVSVCASSFRVVRVRTLCPLVGYCNCLGSAKHVGNAGSGAVRVQQLFQDCGWSNLRFVRVQLTAKCCDQECGEKLEQHPSTSTSFSALLQMVHPPEVNSRTNDNKGVSSSVPHVACRTPIARSLSQSATRKHIGSKVQTQCLSVCASASHF